MTNQIDITGVSPFDAIKELDSDGIERWSARTLQVLMGYARWGNLATAIERAKATARNQGMDVDHNFLRSQKVAGQTGPAPKDFKLTRTAAYLTAMNGDPNKPEVAAAQAYFAITTQEAEAAKSKSPLELLRDQVDIAIAHEKRLTAVEGRQGATEARLEAIEGKHDWFVALGYAKLHGHRTDRQYLAKVGAKATRLMKERGEEPIKRQDATFGTVNLYPIDVLSQAFAETQT
ncbi:hypothetical protein [Nocardiopsis lucentensis]|uniref:hypothetical protein n=1 Tax=Nocardiopsis lucentensis TaxID=53441 RepID=UPI0003456ACB|nr:hypothetical protein [Nocardiopsis lucentensis]